MSVFEITLLAVAIFTGASIVWSTLFLGISPMPSSKRARLAMIQLSEDTGMGPIFELGCGWGNLLIALAKKHPHRKIVGYELSIMPWLMTVLLKKTLKLKNITVYRRNYLDADISSASVIFCYLFPDGMKKIEDKLKCENGVIEYLISNSFALPSHEPVKTIQLADFYHSPVYLYKFSSTQARKHE